MTDRDLRQFIFPEGSPFVNEEIGTQIKTVKQDSFATVKDAYDIGISKFKIQGTLKNMPPHNIFEVNSRFFTDKEINNNKPQPWTYEKRLNTTDPRCNSSVFPRQSWIPQTLDQLSEIVYSDGVPKNPQAADMLKLSTLTDTQKEELQKKATSDPQMIDLLKEIADGIKKIPASSGSKPIIPPLEIPEVGSPIKLDSAGSDLTFYSMIEPEPLLKLATPMTSPEIKDKLKEMDRRLLMSPILIKDLNGEKTMAVLEKYKELLDEKEYDMLKEDINYARTALFGTLETRVYNNVIYTINSKIGGLLDLPESDKGSTKTIRTRTSYKSASPESVKSSIKSTKSKLSPIQEEETLSSPLLKSPLKPDEELTINIAENLLNFFKDRMNADDTKYLEDELERIKEGEPKFIKGPLNDLIFSIAASIKIDSIGLKDFEKMPEYIPKKEYKDKIEANDLLKGRIGAYRIFIREHPDKVNKKDIEKMLKELEKSKPTNYTSTVYRNYLGIKALLKAIQADVINDDFIDREMNLTNTTQYKDLLFKYGLSE
jgi:hypothetical protein